MNRQLAILWGMVTLLPVAYMVYVIASAGSFSGQLSHEEARAQFDFLWRLHMASMALTGGLLLAYIVYLFKTEHVPKDKKALWAVVLFLGNMFAMPVFWVLYVWQPLKRSTSVI